jgi:hypothetical protein
MAKHDDGSGIIAYDSFEELLEDQQEAHDAAVANTTDSQRTIALGGYACNIAHLNDFGPIFGAVQSVREVEAWHQLYYGIGDPSIAQQVLAERGIFKPPRTLGDPESRAWAEDGFASAQEAIDYYIAQHERSYADGYLFGWWLSNVEPDGELGSNHASVCVPISEEIYRDAAANGGYVSQASAVQISAAMKVLAEEYRVREDHNRQGEGDDSEER